MSDRKFEKIKACGAHIGVMLFLLGAASAAGYLLRSLGLPQTNVAIIYLLTVLLTTLLMPGYGFGFIVSILSAFAFNFLFTEPYFTFTANATSYIVTFVIMTITSFITSTLASNVKLSVRKAQESEKETKALYDLTNRLTAAESMSEIKDVALDAVKNTICESASLSFFHDQQTSQEDIADNENEEYQYFEIRGKEVVLGFIRFPRIAAQELSKEQVRLLRSMMESIALAADRLCSAEQRIKLREETSRERYRSNLLRSISHDLRTPLSGILGTSEILLSKTDNNDEKYKLIEGIHKDAIWLQGLVENVLSLTRLQEGNLIINKQPEAVEEVISSAVSHVSRRYPQYDIDANIPDDIFWVPMDAKLIIQVLINFLDNAVKHTSPPGEISVTVTEDTDRKLAVFSVKDNGCGIHSEDLPHLFQMFYTSKTRLGDARLGIGLGLAICDTIVKAHGGMVEAKNRPHKLGAEFIFTLPMEGE